MIIQNYSPLFSTHYIFIDSLGLYKLFQEIFPIGLGMQRSPLQVRLQDLLTDTQVPWGFSQGTR